MIMANALLAAGSNSTYKQQSARAVVILVI